MKKKFGKIPKLIIFSVVIGILVGVLELVIGHRFILDPLLYEDLGFVYESYFAPTYYGLTKTIIISIVTFLTYLFGFKKKIKPILKAVIVGVAGTIILGIYYYFTFPRISFFGGAVIGTVHFLFIAGIPYLFAKMMKLK